MFDKQSSSAFSFIDMLFNLLIGFTFLFVVAFLFINPIAKKAELDPKAEYLIVMTWADGSSSDIDLWVKDHNGNIVSFRNRDIALMHLDRDDLGIANDVYSEIYPNWSNSSKENERNELRLINREVVSIRSKSERTYTVTVHFYANVLHLNNTPPPPELITVELIRVNPYKIEKIQKVTLEGVRQEKHVLKFKVKEKGEVELIDSEELIVNSSSSGMYDHLRDK